jgi:molybdopterin converting factor small subunit
MQMVVSVQFFGVQRALTRAYEIQVPLAEAGDVNNLLEFLKTAYPDLILSKEEVTVSVNNSISSFDQSLNPHDTVCFLPHIGGG